MITLIANDEQVTNVYGFRVANRKLNFTDFNANPVMLYNHDIDRVIGICENIRIEGSQLKFDPKFDEKDPVAMEYKRKVEDGFLRGCSLGFSPDFGNKTYEDNVPVIGGKMIEISITPLPANAGAVRLYNNSREPLQEKEIKLFLNNKLENTENMTDQEKLELQQAKEQIATLSTENKQLKEDATKKHEQEAKALVQLAIDQKKIGDTEKEAYEKLAMQDLESTKKILEAKPVATDKDSIIDHLIDMKAWYDGQDLSGDRSVVLTASHLARIAKEDAKLYKELGVDKGGNIFGFKVWSYSGAPFWNTESKERLTQGAIPGEKDKQGSFFFLGNEVFRCFGQAKMFEETSAGQQGDLISFGVRAAADVLRVKDPKYLAAIV